MVSETINRLLAHTVGLGGTLAGHVVIVSVGAWRTILAERGACPFADGIIIHGVPVWGLDSCPDDKVFLVTQEIATRALRTLVRSTLQTADRGVVAHG